MGARQRFHECCLRKTEMLWDSKEILLYDPGRDQNVLGVGAI
jgi:hypothetical protein